jgi:hypothetical protein
MLKKLYLIKILLFFTITLKAQLYNHKLEKDKFTVRFYIENIKTKDDVLLVERTIRKIKGVEFFMVNRFPEISSSLIAQYNVTPQLINKEIKPLGFEILLDTFLDQKKCEENIYSGRKRNKVEINSK